MDCWQILELDQSADERSVKRSYARLLKLNRPDEDATAFQQLRDAYERALSIARRRGEHLAEAFLQRQAVEQSDAIVDALQSGTDPAEEAFVSDLVQQQLLASSPEHLPEEPWEAPFEAASVLLQVQPAPPAPPVLDDNRVAWALAEGLDADNVQERWELAVLQECEAAFERQLARLCMESPGQRIWLIDWAVQSLHWLTPWQHVFMNSPQQDALAFVLLGHRGDKLRAIFTSEGERVFFAALKLLANEPWLSAFDRRLELQRRILLFLRIEEKWSVGLFEQICQLFHWEESRGITPEPADLWRHVHDRAEQEAFFQQQQALAEARPTISSKQRAARLFLKTPGLYQQGQLTAVFRYALADWQECEKLAHCFQHKYPALRDRVPHADLNFWHRLIPRSVPDSSRVRLAVMVCLIVGQLIVASWRVNDHPDLALAFAVICLGYGTYKALGILDYLWQQISRTLLGADLWLTDRLIPRRFLPSAHWLLIRDGLPWLAVGTGLYLALGLFGPVLAVGFSISDRYVVQPVTAPPPKRFRITWQTVLRRTGCTTAQIAVFLTIAFYYLSLPLATPVAQAPQSTQAQHVAKPAVAHPIPDELRQQIEKINH